MGKVFGILFLVVMVWVGLEFFQHGPSGAFGGALSFATEPADSAPLEQRLSTPQRAGAAVERAQREHQARVDRALGN